MRWESTAEPKACTWLSEHLPNIERRSSPMAVPNSERAK